MKTRWSWLHDHIGFIINDPFKIFAAQSENISDFGGRRPEIPDMNDRHGKRNMTHPFTPDAFLGDLNTAAIADNALVTNAFILPAVALPIPHRTENLLTE